MYCLNAIQMFGAAGLIGELGHNPGSSLFLDSVQDEIFFSPIVCDSPFLKAQAFNSHAVNITISSLS